MLFWGDSKFTLLYSCTLTTLHCSKVSFLQCCHMDIYNTIFTKMWGVYFCEILCICVCVCIYIYPFLLYLLLFYQKFGISKIFNEHKDVSDAQQGCICLIKNIEKNEILLQFKVRAGLIPLFQNRYRSDNKNDEHLLIPIRAVFFKSV